MQEILTYVSKKACSFENLFSRGSDAEIYQERKNLGRLILAVLSARSRYGQYCFSYIPNTLKLHSV
jgi:amidophosphoribosyltransferase